MILGMTAARRVMRRHQGLDVPARHRLPLWRLLLGELLWALRQLWEEPTVLAALLAGGVGTFAVLGEPAPGPVLPVPGRILVALVGGHVLARAAWALARRRRPRSAHEPSGTTPAAKRPALAAAEFVGFAGAIVLLVWLVLWLVEVVA